MPLIAYSPDERVCVYLIQIHLGLLLHTRKWGFGERSMLPQSVKQIVDPVVLCFHEVVLPWRAVLESLSSEEVWIP